VVRSDKSRSFQPDDLQRICAATFVQAVEHHREMVSTNSRALQLAGQREVITPLLVLAERQTAARGRAANRWWSPPGALTFSLLLDAGPLGPQAHGARISLAAGLAVCEALQQLRPGLEIGLKWPNDVYVQDRKICGILVEVPPQFSDGLVLGIGLNVNNSCAQAPPPLPSTATSLAETAQYSFDLTTVLIRVLEQLRIHLELLSKDAGQLATRWQALSLLSGRAVCVDAGSQRTIGVCQEIDRDGALVLSTTDGPRRCLAGVVSFFPPATH
jgi:BirA family biotin operon repressor/biotin-[acetyl-CoA-carboxylase] ligase